MRAIAAKTIRAVLLLPAPRLMTPADRHLYRKAKAHYTRLPHNAKVAYLDSAAAIREVIARRLNAPSHANQRP